MQERTKQQRGVCTAHQQGHKARFWYTLLARLIALFTLLHKDQVEDAGTIVVWRTQRHVGGVTFVLHR